MAKKKNGTASAVSTTKHFNQNRMIELWGKGKSIQEIAQDQGCSPVYARRVLSTKAPEAYNAGLAARHTDKPEPAKTAVVKTNGNGGAVVRGESSLDLNAAIETIARSVASATFSEAQLVPQPITRQEMFNNISKGVRAGIKKMGIGFHS